jgi:hypothetical protein
LVLVLQPKVEFGRSSIMVSQLSHEIRHEESLLGIGHRSYAKTDLARLFGEEDMQRVCPSRTTEVVNVDTGEVRDLPCRKATCHICNRAFVRQVHRAVLLTRPESMILITGLSGCWATDNKAINKFLTALRRDGYEINLVYAIEQNPRLTGHHAHGWFYGSDIPQSHLQRRAHLAGLGRTDMTPVRSSRNFGYPFKGCAWNLDSVSEYGLNNGTMRIHATRGYWRDHRTGDKFDSMETCAAAVATTTPSEQRLWFRAIRPLDRCRSARDIRLDRHEQSEVSA